MLLERNAIDSIAFFSQCRNHHLNKTKISDMDTQRKVSSNLFFISGMKRKSYLYVFCSMKRNKSLFTLRLMKYVFYSLYTNKNYGEFRFVLTYSQK